jgi:hypothetical protein
MIFADRIAQRMHEINGSDDESNVRKASIQVRIVSLTENIAAKFRTAPKEEKSSYLLAISLLNQALIHAEHGDKTKAQRLMAIARRVAR